jgi:hypothetical protein
MSDLFPPDLSDEDKPMSPEYREAIRAKIAAGLKSLREGKGSDGGEFFASMYADLDELERHGRE